MKLQGFTGLEHSFTICLDDRDIEVTDIDYTITEDELTIDSIECDEELDLYELADVMLLYIDWNALEQDRRERHEDWLEEAERNEDF
jgi:hypothetical protein